jgi:FtsP/CotA-like multicopper oxidase with cupredoxin domain
MRRTRATIKMGGFPGLGQDQEKARFYWPAESVRPALSALTEPLRPPLHPPFSLSRRSFVAGTLAAGLGGARGRAAPAAADPPTLLVRTSGYDGQVPGPELRVRRGEEFSVRVINALPEPTAVHWHGVRVPNAMDGAPPLTQPLIMPGASFDYRFIAPDAGTFWYHAPRSDNSVFYGALIVEETESTEVDLVETLIYGYAAAWPDAGTQLRVNGLDNFSMVVTANARVRLRLINATATQILRLRLEDLRPIVMAIDGQPAQPFAAREGELTLGPGNRIDAIFDCTLAPGDAASMTIVDTDRLGHRPVATFRCYGPGRATARNAAKPLPPNPLPERMDFRDAYRFEAVSGWHGPDKKDELQFTVKRGRTVMVGISNSTAASGFIHLHGHSFRLLDALDDGWKPFWLDTMPVASRSKARIAFVADNPGKWLIEGLVTQSGAGIWFEVT